MNDNVFFLSRFNDGEKIIMKTRDMFKSQEKMANIAVVDKLVQEVEKKMVEMNKIAEVVRRTSESKAIDEVEIRKY